MSSQMLLCAFVALSATFCLEAYPVYPDIDGMQDFVPTDFNLVDNTVGFVPDDVPFTGVHQPRNLNSALSALEEGINPFQKSGPWNGGKESLQNDVHDKLVVRSWDRDGSSLRCVACGSRTADLPVVKFSINRIVQCIIVDWENYFLDHKYQNFPANADHKVDDVKAILWKLVAADKLRSHAFVKADQSSPQKPSKRACFWKYCVTN